jgi:ParB family transcriptional regulator, chromosome partitioning protein
LAEWDENLCSTKLTPAERAIFTQRRKDAYEALHPETRHGANHAPCGQFGHTANLAFVDATASKTGRSERDVQRDATRGACI